MGTKEHEVLSFCRQGWHHPQPPDNAQNAKLFTMHCKEEEKQTPKTKFGPVLFSSLSQGCADLRSPLHAL